MSSPVTFEKFRVMKETTSGAFLLEPFDHVRNRAFGWNGEVQVDMVRADIAFDHDNVVVLTNPLKYLLHGLGDSGFGKDGVTIFGDKNQVVTTIISGMGEFAIVIGLGGFHMPAF